MSQRALGVQFQYSEGDDKAYRKNWTHTVEATTPKGETVGYLHWGKDTGRVRNIQVDHGYRRQGIATQLWEEAHRVATETRGVTPPKHSTDRTDAGDAWARSVSSRLPRRRTD